MRTCHRAQGTLLCAVWRPKRGGNPKRRYRNTVVDSLCCTRETNTALLGNYAPKKKKRIIGKDSKCVFPSFPCCSHTIFIGFKYF